MAKFVVELDLSETDEKRIDNLNNESLTQSKEYDPVLNREYFLALAELLRDLLTEDLNSVTYIEVQ